MRNALPISILFIGLSTAACTTNTVGEPDATELGSLANDKNDAPEIRELAVSIAKAGATRPGARNFTVDSDEDFTVSLAYEGAAQSRIIVTGDDGSQTITDRVARPSILVHADGQHTYKVRLENFDAATLRAKLSILDATSEPAIDPSLIAAARLNLQRISKEIDSSHLGYYGLKGAIEDRFLEALKIEYAEQHPDQYRARLTALASMSFFALPEVMPPEAGRTTPFHGLDESQFESIMSIEDTVFNQHVSDNGGSVSGVRPFSVCETTYLIETYVRPRIGYPGYPAYKAGYDTFEAANCSEKDKNEWYNFRGLGALRPSWVESNLSDRFLRRNAKGCQKEPAASSEDCAAWNADRMGYRMEKTRELASRTMFYAMDTQGYLINPNNSMVFLEDRNADGVGEFLRPGMVTLKTGETGTLTVSSIGRFSGKMTFAGADGVMRNITPDEIVAEEVVNPLYDATKLGNADWGLMSLFADNTGCTADAIDPSTCPLLQRFYSMIDRHENFYRTYSALNGASAGLSSQPSPLVACSITLRASHHWDTAGTPEDGTAGFIFLMRIPFSEILAGSRTSVATQTPAPRVTAIQDIYAGQASLDMSRMWLDVATLSNNQYASEHEISAFGAVPAGEIEGILVIRRPAALAATTPTPVVEE